MVAELEHRALPPADHQCVELAEVEVCQPGRLLEQGDDLGRVEGSHRDQVVGRPADLVTRIGQGVDLDLAAVGLRRSRGTAPC